MQLWPVGATLRYSAWASCCSGLSCWGAWALQGGLSFVVVHGISCSMACGIFLDQGYILNHWTTRKVPGAESFNWHFWEKWASLVAQMVKNLLAMQETWVRALTQEGLLEKGMAIHFGVLAWEIPWREKSSRLQSMGSQRVRHDWATNAFLRDGQFTHPLLLDLIHRHTLVTCNAPLATE